MDKMISQVWQKERTAVLLFGCLSLLFLIYLLLPGPSSISDFPPLPNSHKSTLEGDTTQVANVAGYFSNNYRDFSTNFFKDSYQKLMFLQIPPLRLNYPPEFAYTAIKDQTQSTYLEEFVYPFRESLYVNGLEPFYEDGQTKWEGATKFEIGGVGNFDTKVTLHYYPSPLWARLANWVGINLSIIGLWLLGKKLLWRR